MADELVIRIKTQDEASAAIDRIKQSVEGLGDAAKGAGDSAGGFSLKTAGIAAGAAVAVTAVAGLAAAFGAVDAAVNAAMTGIARGGFFDDLSKKIGVSVENLSRLEIAATTSGVSMQGLATGLKFLSRNMVEAAQGGEAQAAAFASIGIAVTDASGRLRDTNEVLLDAVDVFSRMAPSAQKTAVAMEIFGKAGAELLPFLDAGREGLLEFQQINDKLGLTITSTTSAALDGVGDSLDILGKVGEGVAQQFAAGLAPALEEVTSGLVDLVAEIGIGDGTIKSFGATVGEALRSGFEKVKGEVENLKEIFTTLSFDDAMAVMGTRLDAALQSAFESAIWAAARAAKSVFLTAVDWVFGSVDLAAIAATKNERLIRDQLGELEQDLRTRFGAGATADSDFVRTAAQHDVAVRQLVAGIDTLRGSLGSLAGDQLVAAAAAAKHEQATVDQTVAANLEAIGLGKSAEAFRFYEVAGVAAVTTTKDNTAAKTEHQSAAAKESEALVKSAAAMAAKTAITQAETAAMLVGVEAGDSYATIMDDVARAALETEAAQKLQEGATLASVEAWLEESLAAQEAADAKKAAQAVVDYAKETADLEAQVEVWRQVRDGIITTAEAYHELAVQAEMAKTKVDRGAADAIVTAREKAQKEIDEIKKSTEEVVDTTTDALSQIDDAFSKMLDGLISGTLDFGDIWKSMAASMLQDFASSVGGIRGLFDGLGRIISGSSVNSPDLYDKNGNVVSRGGALLDLIGGGTDRFQKPVTDQWGNVQYDESGAPVTATDWGAVAGSAAQGGATAYASFRPATDTQLEGLIAKGTERGVLSAANGLGQVVGTAVGAVASIWLGPLGGVLGGVVGSGLASLIAGSVDRDTFLKGEYTGFVGFQQDAFKPMNSAILGPLVMDSFLQYLLTDAVLNLPTLGLAMRKGAESVLDESQTFGAAQARYGDITVRSGGPEGVYRNNLTGADTARARGFSQGEVDLTQGATAAIFGQIAEGEMAEDAGRLGEAMGNIMAEFLSRGLEDGVDFEGMFDLLRQFAHEAGIDLFTSMKSLDDVMADSIAAGEKWGKLDPMAAAAQGARAYAEALVGTTAVFEGDFPAGVNLTAIALRNFEKDGVNAFGEMDDAAKDTLRNLSDDTALTMDVVQKLVEQGFTIDTEAFQRQVEAISGSASFIGQNIGAVFAGPSVFAGIEAMGEELRAQIKNSITSKATEQLFDKTRIAESFAPVYEVIGKLEDGEFDLTDAVGAESFKNQMVLAIANGKATLQEYIPQLRAIRDAADEVDKAIEEALKPSSEEAFWLNVEETLKSNADAVKSMAGDMFEVAVQAERAGAGLSFQETRDAMQRQVDQGIYTATQLGVETAAGESPEAKRLAQLTTEFQFKVAAALKDGVISASEQADLTLLKTKLTNAGNAFADVVSSGTAGLADLFRVDRLKEAITAAAATLKDSVGSAAGSMFEKIKEGGSTAEGVAAFGESFKQSVRDNVLAGMQEALVQSVVMEGALANLMGQMKQAVSVAMEDGMISADEQTFINTLAQGIGTATDATLTALQPTLDALGNVAQTVVGNTDTATANLGELDRQTRSADYGVDEMARRAARNLEQVGDAVPEETTGAIKEGIDKLAVAVGDSDGVTTDIKDGISAMAGALGAQGSGGVPEDIKAGIGAMAGALGAQASGGVPEDLKAGIGKMAEALGTQGAGSGMADAVGAVRDALVAGSGGEGLQGAIEGAAGAMLGSSGLTAAAGEAAGAIKDALGQASQDAAGALQDKLIAGLEDARGGLGDFADLLRNFKLPIANSAKGGSFKSGMSFVGEEGMELVVANEGGGFTVIPLNGVPHAADGISMDENGAATQYNIGIRPGGGSRGGTGPFGRPRIPPYAPPPPRSDESDDEEAKVSVSFDFSSALADFFKGGTRKELRNALKETTGEGIIAGMIDAMLAKAGLEEFQTALGETIEKAMEDGKLSADELADIEKMGDDFKAKLVDMADELGPAFKVIAEAFGLDLAELGLDPTTEYLTETLGPSFLALAEEFGLELGKDTYENLLKGAQAGADAIGGALRSVLNDPSKLTMENLNAALKTEIYNSVSSGLIDAFIQSAVVQGALAVPLGIIQAAFAAVAQGQMTAAEANVAIGEQVADILSIINGPEFAAMMQPVLDGLKQLTTDLGQTGNAVAETVPPFQDAAQAAEDACTGECDLEYKLAVAQTGIGNLTDAGGAGVFGIEYYEPQRKFARGGFVRGSARGVPGIFGEAGDEIVMPLDGAEAQAALAAAAAGFAVAAGSGARASAAAESSAALEARVAEMSAAVREQVDTLRDENAKLREALAATVGELAARPVVVELDGQPIATAVVGALERSTRSGRSRLDRTR